MILVKTCDACPEQYDLYRKNKLVGYLRLRHGYFTARYPDVNGRVVYHASTKGDGQFGEDERPIHLKAAKKAIKNAIKEEKSR